MNRTLLFLSLLLVLMGACSSESESPSYLADREKAFKTDPRAWGYNKEHNGNHKSAEDVLKMLSDAQAMDANLLLNVGPKGDGSFPEEDIRALLEARNILLQQMGD
jgi:alpha-L-fucosidase